MTFISLVFILELCHRSCVLVLITMAICKRVEQVSFETFLPLNFRTHLYLRVESEKKAIFISLNHKRVCVIDFKRVGLGDACYRRSRRPNHWWSSKAYPWASAAGVFKKFSFQKGYHIGDSSHLSPWNQRQCFSLSFISFLPFPIHVPPCNKVYQLCSLLVWPIRVSRPVQALLFMKTLRDQSSRCWARCSPPPLIVSLPFISPFITHIYNS